MVRVGVGRDYQQQDLVAVESEDFERVYRLKPVSVESYVAPAGREFSGCFCPVAEVVKHAIDGLEPNRQHRKQVWKLFREVITVRPPGPSTYPDGGALGFNRNRGV